MKPLVSVIAISYNHAAYIQKALGSLFEQTYDAWEVILIDDASSDDSVAEIETLIASRNLQLIKHEKNQGYTKTFNEGLKMAKGEYVIDFALDDIMLPNFISNSVELLEQKGDEYGLVFSNAAYIDNTGKVIGNHNELLFKKKMIDEVPQGDVFQWVLRRYFICTPTMVMKKSMLDKLLGYDESLAYEDFDLWVRAARYWKFAYLDEVTLQKRKLLSSMSAQRHLHHYNEQMTSAFKVCNKAFHLCKTKLDLAALFERINYEYRQCIKYGAEELADQYVELINHAGGKLTLKSRGYRWHKRKFRVIQ